MYFSQHFFQERKPDIGKQKSDYLTHAMNKIGSGYILQNKMWPLVRGKFYIFAQICWPLVALAGWPFVRGNFEHKFVGAFGFWP